MRRTKIVATLGPSTDEPKVLRAILEAGLNVARFNFSHGSHEEHKTRLDALRNLCKELGKSIAIMADTKGPEVRLGCFEGGRTELESGNLFTLTTADIVGDNSRVSVTYESLPDEVTEGTRILLDDGLIELVVESVLGKEIKTKVLNGGPISNRKGVNVPSINLKLPYISAKDRMDLRFCIENDFDFVAASFVRSAEDIREMREELYRLDYGNKIKIIAKIENAQGVKNADSILTASDGLMVARGDLGVELDYEELPIIQKELIKKSVSQGKPCITATQMLESMMNNPKPTRAEASDVANAIYDGTSAIMLSGETAAGKYPLKAFITMSKIAERIERDIDYRQRFFRGEHRVETSITSAISHATVTTAHNLRTAAIITVSMTGTTAQNVSKFRPECPIIACTPNPIVERQLNLNWGIVPLLTEKEAETTVLFNSAVEAALAAKYVEKGDLVVLTSGVPVGHSGTTNMLMVHVVGAKMRMS
ncbi:MAG: pyruvate kinase [Oscillospiraceae bacterium]|nr:pyruvate kinase [Oscillospiraceae bacterium]